MMHLSLFTISPISFFIIFLIVTTPYAFILRPIPSDISQGCDPVYSSKGAAGLENAASPRFVVACGHGTFPSFLSRYNTLTNEHVLQGDGGWRVSMLHWESEDDWKTLVATFSSLRPTSSSSDSGINNNILLPILCNAATRTCSWSGGPKEGQVIFHEKMGCTRGDYCNWADEGPAIFNSMTMLLAVVVADASDGYRWSLAPLETNSTHLITIICNRTCYSSRSFDGEICSCSHVSASNHIERSVNAIPSTSSQSYPIYRSPGFPEPLSLNKSLSTTTFRNLYPGVSQWRAIQNDSLPNGVIFLEYVGLATFDEILDKVRNLSSAQSLSGTGWTGSMVYFENAAQYEAITGGLLGLNRGSWFLPITKRAGELAWSWADGPFINQTVWEGDASGNCSINSFCAWRAANPTSTPGVGYISVDTSSPFQWTHISGGTYHCILQYVCNKTCSSSEILDLENCACIAQASPAAAPPPVSLPQNAPSIIEPASNWPNLTTWLTAGTTRTYGSVHRVPSSWWFVTNTSYTNGIVFFERVVGGCLFPEFKQNVTAVRQAQRAVSSDSGWSISMLYFKNASQYQEMVAFLPGSLSTLFLPISDAAVEGSFVWVDGPYENQTVTYKDAAYVWCNPLFHCGWASGEPNDLGGEDYVTTTGPIYQWVDVPANIAYTAVVMYASILAPIPVHDVAPPSVAVCDRICLQQSLDIVNCVCINTPVSSPTPTERFVCPGTPPIGAVCNSITGTWVINGSFVSPPSGWTVDHPVVIRGNFSSTTQLNIGIGGSPGMPVLTIEGCATFGGSLIVNVAPTTTAAANSTIFLATFAGGYCGGETTRFTSVSTDLPCTDASVVYGERSLIVLVSLSDRVGCVPVGSGQLSSAALGGIIASVVIFVVVAAVIFVLFILRHRIIPAYKASKYINKSKTAQKNAPL